MAYSKQTWVDGAGGGTPISAARLSHVEDGIAAAASTADDAMPTSGGTLTGGVVIAAVDGAPDPDTLPLGVIGARQTGLIIASSPDGGEDDVDGVDTTGRISLYSYQRAAYHSLGEVMRVHAMRVNSKQMIAWYFPSGGYDADGEPVGTMQPAVWIGAHWQANDGGSYHDHLGVETRDADGALQTRFEIRFADPNVTDALTGLDKTLIMTNLADFVVRCSNGQVLRLSAQAGTEKVIEFSNDAEGATSYRRWRIRVTSDAETGGNVGSNFAVSRYADDGSFVDSPVHVSRSSGRVGVGVTDPAVRLDIGDDRIRIRNSRTPASVTAFGNQGDICWDSNYVYVCVAPSTWRRAALSAW